ncbi:MAG: hypothetical protein ACYSU0_05635 [Planctomycetota bacterium]
MLGDVLFFILALVSIPILVRVYATRGGPLGRHRPWIMLAASVWLLYAVFHAEFSQYVFGKAQADAASHTRIGLEIARGMALGRWSYHLERARLGNGAFRFYLGVIYFLTGSRGLAPVLLHMVLAFWGALQLAALLVSDHESKRAPAPLVALMLFTPSVVFWTTTNLKEGIMFWATCSVFSAAAPAEARNRWGMTLLLMATLVGGLFRPHMMIVWLAALLVVGLLRRGYRLHAAAAVVLIPILTIALDRMTGFGMSVSGAADYMETHYHGIVRAGGGSTIYYEGGRPMFLVSGLATLFLRPFLWEVRTFAQMAASVEILLMTVVMAYLWIKLPPGKRREAFRTPTVRVALIVCLLFCVMFPWMGNEGLLVRQRIHAMGALLALIAVPWLHRSAEEPGPITRRHRVAATRTPV